MDTMVCAVIRVTSEIVRLTPASSKGEAIEQTLYERKMLSNQRQVS